MRLPSALLMSLLPLTVAAAPPPVATDSVRIYRCVGSSGALTLQDSPCTSGREEVREMQRPKDPPPRRASTSDAPAAATAAAAQAPREVRHVYVQPPRPMYECVAEDGHRYVSDSNEGNPRWVSIWAQGWGPGDHRPWQGGPHRPGRPGGPGLPPVRGELQTGVTQRPPPHGAGIGFAFPAGSVLVRDACNALPQQEVCARLRDQRWDLDRRYNSALQGERNAITREQRGIDARLEQDCAGR